MKVNAPTFEGLRPRSRRTSRLAAAASKKKGTRCELALEASLSARKLRFRLHVQKLPGCPDIVFPSSRVAVFVDGDFWHGRHLRQRVEKLSRGHNASYWVQKVRTNVERDRMTRARLRREGWHVIRVWEKDVLRDAERVAQRIANIARQRAGRE
jgi:DNA mismatch endonuclease, patch repair protein